MIDHKGAQRIFFIFLTVRSKPASSTIIAQWQDLFSGAELEGDLIIKEVENIEAKMWKVKTGNSTHILYITNQANKYHKVINPLGGKPACRSETPDFQVESLSLTSLTSATITVVAQHCHYCIAGHHLNLHDIKIRTLDCQASVDYFKLFRTAKTGQKQRHRQSDLVTQWHSWQIDKLKSWHWG